MTRSRYDYNENVYIYITHTEKLPQNKYTRIAFEDNLEHKIEDEYSIGGNKAICEKIVLVNGKFTVKFDREFGSYGTTYGPSLWDTIVTHEGLSEPMHIGIPTYNILRILKNNTVTNAEIKNVYIAMNHKLIEIMLQGDAELATAQYDGKIRHEITKRKTVKREPGYKYVSIGTELNYLCDVTMLSAQVSWYNRYGRPTVTENSNFAYAIRCGKIPVTLYVTNDDNNYKTSTRKLFDGEIDILNKSLEVLRKSKKTDNMFDMANNADCYGEARGLLYKSFMHNSDTIRSLKLDNKKHSKKSMAKADAWLEDIDSIDIKSELMKFRDECQRILSEFIHESGILLPPEYLVYLIRMDNENFISLTNYERDILESVKEYCMMSNQIQDEARKNGTDNIANALSFASYDISELELIY